MNRGTLLILAVALAALAAAAVVTVRRGARPSEPRRLWPGGGADKARRVVLTRPGGRLEFVRRDGSWEMAAPLAYPANAAVFQEFVDKLAQAALQGPLTESPEKRELFGLGSADAIRLEVAGEAALDLWAGKAGNDTDTLYVRLGSAPQIFEARGLSRYDVERSTLEWLSKTILALPREGLEAVVLKTTHTVSLARGADGGWSLEGRGVALSTAPGSPVNVLEGTLYNFTADQLMTPPLPALPAQPALQVRVRWSEKGARREAALSAYREKDGMVPLVLEGESRVRFLVYPFRLEAFRKPPAEFR